MRVNEQSAEQETKPRPRRFRRLGRVVRWPFVILAAAVLFVLRLARDLVGLAIALPWRAGRWAVRATASFGRRLRTGDVAAIVTVCLLAVCVSTASAVVVAARADGDGPRGGDAALADRAGPAVFKVDTDGCDFEGGGTAFAIDEHHLVTNWHVVMNDTEPGLTSRDGERLDGRVIGWSIAKDVAVIEVDELLPRTLEWADPDDLREGDHLLALGYPVPGHDFSATPAAIVSFDTVGDSRRTIRSDANVDHGNSGGPALTAAGDVAGVVTRFDPNMGGIQLVALISTHDRLAVSLDDIFENPRSPKVDCEFAAYFAPVDDYYEDEYYVPQAYGDDPYLDDLYDACAEGDLTGCDDLWHESTPGSEYEAFAESCGDLTPDSFEGTCEVDFTPVPDGPAVRGDDPRLDKLFDLCGAGDDDACDLLFLRSERGTAYQSLADICGGRRPPGSGGQCGEAAAG